MIFYLIRLGFRWKFTSLFVRINKSVIVHLVRYSLGLACFSLSFSLPLSVRTLDFLRLSYLDVCMHLIFSFILKPTFPTFFHLFLFSCLFLSLTKLAPTDFFLFHICWSKRPTVIFGVKKKKPNPTKIYLWMNLITDCTMHDRTVTGKKMIGKALELGMKIGERSNNWWRDDQ